MKLFGFNSWSFGSNEFSCGVSEKATLSKGVVIGNGAIVEDDCVIGEGTIIHPNAIIRNGARIGRNCQIHPFSVISGIPQDLKFKGEETQTVIGDNTTIREFVTINRGTASKGKTVIGENCLIMAYCHVAHDCVLRNHVILGNLTQLAGEVQIDDHAIVSGGSLVHQFVRISRHVMIQGGSKVTQDIPPYVLAGREPLAFCGLNIVGLTRRGFTDAQINTINRVYRILYLQGLNVSDALLSIEKNCPQTPEVELIVSFIRSTKRTILRGNMV